MTLRVSLFAGAAALASFCLAGPAAAAADTAAAARSNTIEEVVITARKQSENLQKVPLSVTSQSGVQLQQKSIVETGDLTRIVPSLYAPQSDYSNADSLRIALRGQVASDLWLGIGPAVGLYEDNVNIPHPVGANSAFYDLDRVEVLHGPQGTLYGRNTTGGAINIITKSADYAGVHGFIDGDFGNYRAVKLTAAVNVPIIPDMLAVRIALQQWNQDGYVRSSVTGQRFGNEHDDTFGRVSVRFDPVSNFTATLKGEYGRADRTASPQSPRELPVAGQFIVYANQALYADYKRYAPLLAKGLFLGDAAALGQVLAAGKAITDPCLGGSFFTNCEGNYESENIKYGNAVLDWKWDINDKVSLRSISGYHSFDTGGHVYAFGGLQSQIVVVGAGSAASGGVVPSGLQPNGTPYSLPFPLRSNQKDRVWSQEFNLTGKLLDDKLNWLVGAYGSTDLGHTFEAHVAYGGALGVIGGGDPSVAGDVARHTDKGFSFFTQEDYHFSDKVSLTLGGRYTKERIGQVLANWTYFNNADGTVAAKPADALGPAIAAASGLRYTCQGKAADGLTSVNFAPPVTDNSDSCATSVYSTGPNNAFSTQQVTGYSYLASLNFQVTDDVLAYFKTARGFRAGAFGRGAQIPAKPETNTDYEVGLKGDFLDHRLRTNLAVYQTNYSNKQVTIQVCVSGKTPPCLGAGDTTTLLKNAANVRIRGAELEWQAAPVEGLSLFGTASFTDPKFIKYPGALIDGSGAVYGDGAGLNTGDVPKWETDTGARYEFPVGPGVLALQADYSWRSKIPVTPLKNDPGYPPGFLLAANKSLGLVNARVEYRDDSLGLTAAFWVTNLANKTWFLQGLSPGFGSIVSAVTQPPREFGVELRKTFGGG